MAVFSRQVSVFIDKRLSGKARAQTFANYARRVEREIQEHNMRILGFETEVTRAVDGVKDAPLNRVKPGGVIFLTFEVGDQLFKFVSELLEKVSPFDPTPDGVHYKDHHVIYVDDVLWRPGDEVRSFDRAVISNEVIYVNELERDIGFYESIVMPVLIRNFGDRYSFKFGYTSDYTDGRVAAIFVRPN